MTTDNARPLRVYGSEISYFTGKLEGYLRYAAGPVRARHQHLLIPRNG